MKIAVNRCFGGFDLSPKAKEMLFEARGVEFEKVETNGITLYFEKGYAGNRARYLLDPIVMSEVDRNDPDLIRIIEELGVEASSEHSLIKIVEIPDDVYWVLDVSDSGWEQIAEKHRTW